MTVIRRRMMRYLNDQRQHFSGRSEAYQSFGAPKNGAPRGAGVLIVNADDWA